MNILPKKFYSRRPDKVAKELLGKIIVKQTKNNTIEGIIVETEAYFDKNDPASRASFSEKWEEKLKRESGITFVYMVHGHWLFNVVSHKPNDVGAVLIRAVQPIKGLKIMKKNRYVKNEKELTNGPGKFTKAFSITKEHDNIPVYTGKTIWIKEGIKVKNRDIGKRKRIGVRADLEEDLCFYIKENPFVSKI